VSMGDGDFIDMPAGARFIIKMRWASEFPAFIRSCNAVGDTVGPGEFWNGIQRLRFI